MLIWLIATAAVCILLGAILTLWVEWHLFSQPVRAQKHTLADDDPLSHDENPIELPEVLQHPIIHIPFAASMDLVLRVRLKV